MRWFILVVVVAVVAGTVARVRMRGRQNNPEVGSVSEEWIAQHQSGLPHA